MGETLDKQTALVTFPFFVGADRSGTTLLRAMFDSHPKLAIPHESRFVVRMAENVPQYETPDGFATTQFLTDLLRHRGGIRRWGLPEEDVRAAVTEARPARYADAMRALYALYARSQAKPRYGDKTPGFVRHMPLLSTLFPEARFVHVIRDGRDVALSLMEVEWGPRTIGDAALFWRRRVRPGREVGRALGSDRYREIRYEDLVEDPQGSLERLCAFIGLPYDAQMLHYFERASALVAPTRWSHRHQRLFLPPTKGLRDWRSQMSKEDVALFEALAGELLRELGYERTLEGFSRGQRLDAHRRRMLIVTRRFGHRSRRALRRARRRLGMRS
jgi:hypothetical protein